ncbi:hypothetical protein XENOCAPTIV_017977 [Xenoophorus captivus]|uniref:Centromere protein O n=1 Tax=Xenoophorus captivus TaxID=1517983 RepID=A0ABV0S133_9TELE
MGFSLATAYEGVYLDTYNLEIDLRPKVRITRHNIPPFIPLNNLAEQSDLQTGLRAFLDTVSQHLNAFAGRKQQLKLVKEQHKSVEVMESNLLCSILVLMFTVPKEKTPLLCTLEYTDHTRCLPTRVHLDSEGRVFAFQVFAGFFNLTINNLLSAATSDSFFCRSLLQVKLYYLANVFSLRWRSSSSFWFRTLCTLNPPFSTGPLLNCSIIYKK